MVTCVSSCDLWCQDGHKRFMNLILGFHFYKFDWSVLSLLIGGDILAICFCFEWKVSSCLIVWLNCWMASISLEQLSEISKSLIVMTKTPSDFSAKAAQNKFNMALMSSSSVRPPMIWLPAIISKNNTFFKIAKYPKNYTKKYTKVTTKFTKKSKTLQKCAETNIKKTIIKW
jgi:hypothetical protein